jgi:hypothetical protein
MVSERRSARRALYRALIALHPRPFREQLGESMEQTFDDLCHELRGQSRARRYTTVLWLFADTAVGLCKERTSNMTQLWTNPRLAAFVSFMLALPISVVYLSVAFNIAVLETVLKAMLTVDGDRPNAIGFVVLIGGILVLPVAFVLNLLPMVRRIGPERRRSLYPLNLLVGAFLLFFLAQTWGALILEEIACRSGVPNCD